MLKCEEMTQVRITAPKNKMKSVINALYDLRLLHFIEFKKKAEKEFLDIAEPLGEGEQYSEQLLKLRAIIEYFQLTGKGEKIFDLQAAGRKLERIKEEFLQKKEELEELRKQKEHLQSELENPLLLLGLDAALLQEFATLNVFKGTVKESPREELQEKIKEFELIEKKTENKETVFALFVPKKLAEKTAEVLKKYDFKEKKLETSKSLKELNEELKGIEYKLGLAEKKIEKFKENHSAFLVGFESVLAELSEKAEAPLKFASTKNSFIITGWVPTEKFNALKERLGKETGEKIFIEEFKEKEGAPIAFKNPVFAKPYQFLLDLYSLPQYYEIDPTLLMAFTFPLFFGFMLGDIGYGLTTLIIFLLARKFLKMPALNPLLGIGIIASISTIVFGFVFGEFYGFPVIAHPILHRADEIQLMILISVLVGLIHLNLGFVIGFFNALKKHSLFKAFAEKGSWIVLEVGVAIVALNMLPMISIPFAEIIGGVIALLGVGLLYIGEGITGLIELPSLLSHTLSYARLFGIGLASVQLAFIINKFVGEFFAMGGVGIIAAVLILIMGHTLNIFLGVLGPFIQSLRLHYVEFFTKFYKGGGIPYSPFGQKII